MLERVILTGKVTLKELRKLTGLNQADFAKEMNIPLTTYRRYESDVRSMDFGKLVDICERLGIGVEMISL